MKGLVNSPALADPPVTAVLKPGFTALSNALIDSGLLAQLKPTEVNLFLVLARFSTGFLRLQAIIGEQKLMELTGASQSSLYEAKKGLVQRGLITIAHTKTGRCLYQLGKLFQPLLTPGEQPEPIAKPVWVGPSRQLEGNPSEQPESYKEFKEIQDQHHPVPATSNPNDDDFLGSEVRGVTGGSLVERLKQLGVNEFMAHRLTKSKPLEIIERAIQRVRTLEVTNPAGYLVSEILRGGYQEKPDATKAQRDLHREIQEKRQAERQKLEQQHQQSQSQAEQLWQKFLSLPSGHQLELKQKIQAQAEREGFSRLRGWGEEHPTWRGLLLEEFQIWQTSGGSEKPASATAEPCSIGVSPPTSPKFEPPTAGGFFEASSSRPACPAGSQGSVFSSRPGAACPDRDILSKAPQGQERGQNRQTREETAPSGDACSSRGA